MFDIELDFWGLKGGEGSNKEKLKQMLNSEPSQAGQIETAAWKKLGPLNIDKIIKEHKIEFDNTLEYKEIHRLNGRNQNYYGQVNSQNQPEGFGR